MLKIERPASNLVGRFLLQAWLWRKKLRINRPQSPRRNLRELQEGAFRLPLVDFQLISVETLFARPLVATPTLLTNAGADWWRRENVRAKMRIAVKKILQRHGYPPDLTSDAIKMVLKQAEALALEVSA